MRVSDWSSDVCSSDLPFPYLAQARSELEGSGVAWGAQDVSVHAQGAYTGEVSAAMLGDFACGWVLTGHSERRGMHGETDQLVADKARAALLEIGRAHV